MGIVGYAFLMASMASHAITLRLAGMIEGSSPWMASEAFQSGMGGLSVGLSIHQDCRGGCSSILAMTIET
jgi:hypothetical protein